MNQKPNIVLLYLIICVLCFLVAFLDAEQGKELLAWLFLAAGLLYLVVGLLTHISARRDST